MIVMVPVVGLEPTLNASSVHRTSLFAKLAMVPPAGVEPASCGLQPLALPLCYGWL